jgi:hypothetical protein
MGALLREIEKQARLLSVEERELLAERLLATASGAALTDLDIIWLEDETIYVAAIMHMKQKPDYWEDRGRDK